MALTFQFNADGSRYTRGLEKMRGQTKAWSNGIKGMIGGAFAMGAVIAGFNRLIDRFDRIDKLSKRFGVSAEAIQKMGFAAEQNGASIEQMAKAMAQGNRAAVEASNGLKTYQRAFDALNINVEEFRRMDQEDQMRRIADAVKGAKDQNLAMASAQQLLGRSALELMPLLKKGSQGINDLTDDLKTLTDEQIESFAAAKDSINKTQNQLSATLGVWINNIIQGFKAIIATITQGAIEMGEAYSSMGKIIKNGLKGDFKAAETSAESMVKKMKGSAGRMKDAWQEAFAGDVVVNAEARGGGAAAEAEAEQAAALKSRLDIEKKITEERKKQRAETETLKEQVETAQKEWKALQDTSFKVGVEADEEGATEGQKAAAANAELDEAKAYTKFIKLRNRARDQEKKEQEKRAKDEADIAKEKLENEARVNKPFEDIEAAETNVIASSLASIGGGGNVASFTSDPVLAATIESNKILAEIQKNTKPTPAAPTIPEI